ncbi:MAG: TlpA disulfide reductase family protein [Bacteroidota bacterium]
MKKTIKELSITIILLAVLFGTGLNVPLAGFVQGLVLKTGLLSPSIDTPETDKNFNHELLLRNEEGELVDVADLRGKTLFVNFWASWCPPCIAEMPEIQDLYKNSSEDVAFLIISVDEDFKKALKFKEKKGYAFPVYRLASRLPAELRGNSIPRTYVISPEGNIAYEHSGMASYGSDKFMGFVNSL